MNILMVLESTFPPDERVENEISLLTSIGMKITLVCFNNNTKLQIEYLNNLIIIRIPISNFTYKSSALALLLPFYFNFWKHHLKKILKKNKFDALHLHDLPLIRICLELSKEYNIPLIGDYHENRPEIMKLYHHIQTFPGRFLVSLKQWNQYQLKYTPKVNQLILVTDEAKEYYMRKYGINPQNITVLPNYIDWKRISSYTLDRTFHPEIKEKFTVLYFGDTGLRRGTLTIIQAAEELKLRKDICFLIIGDSKEQIILENEIKNRNLTNIILTGWISVSEAFNYIHISKVGLCPFLRNVHHDTTYANKMFQYMAFRKPVIVSDCNAQANLVLKENAGLVFTAGDEVELSKRILEVTNKNVYEQLSKSAFNCVMHKYNWQVSGQRLISLYEKLKK